MLVQINYSAVLFPYYHFFQVKKNTSLPTKTEQSELVHSKTKKEKLKRDCSCLDCAASNILCEEMQTCCIHPDLTCHLGADTFFKLQGNTYFLNARAGEMLIDFSVFRSERSSAFRAGWSKKNEERSKVTYLE